MNISVALAAYNGEKYIEKQIKSILYQLKEDDELIISINPSTDNTVNIIQSLKETDKRIHYYFCGKTGVIHNFGNALKHCNNEIIFLSDQDDIWEYGKVEKQLKLLEQHDIYGVCHGCCYIDSDDNIINKTPRKRMPGEIRYHKILVRNPVQGCTLAFKREVLKLALPFPENIPMHDSWIGLWICRLGKLLYLDEPLLLYRQHDGTVTTRKHKKLLAMIYIRCELLFSYILRRIRNW